MHGSFEQKSIDEAFAFMGHERNKHLLIFQSSKRARELSKHMVISEQHPLFLMLALGFVRKGLMVVQTNLNMLKNKVNLFSLANFEIFCDSPAGH